MSVDVAEAVLSKLSIEDQKLKANLNKLHLSHQHSFLPWRHLSAAHLQTLAGQSPAERRTSLRAILQLQQRFPLGEQHVRDVSGTREQQAQSQAQAAGMPDTNLTRQEIVIDFALAILGFCWTNELNALKSSTFFSILYQTHQEVSEIPGPQPSAKDSWLIFERHLLRHSIERPPFSICCFSPPEVSLLSQWTLQTYFAQLKLYQYTFGTANELEIQATNSVAQSVDPTLVGVSLWSNQPIPQEWSLDFAKNYFPHSTHSNASGVTEQATEQPGDEITDETFRDETTGIEFLQTTTDAAVESAQLIASNSSNSNLLADPADQALFDAAMSKELAVLYKDFGQQLAKQQELFTRKLAELDPTNTTITGPPTSRSTASTITTTAARATKSRGKQ